MKLTPELQQKAMAFAIKVHDVDSNQKYNQHPYSYHLWMVTDTCLKYDTLLSSDLLTIAYQACWLHDTIEDARQTYNDIKQSFGEEVADVVYALTNEKGKTRKDRANDKYYEGIRSVPAAVFVKMCDRIANATFSAEKNSSMLSAYRKENNHFLQQMGLPDDHPMVIHLNEILALPKT